MSERACDVCGTTKNLLNNGEVWRCQRHVIERLGEGDLVFGGTQIGPFKMITAQIQRHKFTGDHVLVIGPFGDEDEAHRFLVALVEGEADVTIDRMSDN